MITLEIPKDLIQALAGLITAGAKSQATGADAFAPAAQLLFILQKAVSEMQAPPANGHAKEDLNAKPLA